MIGKEMIRLENKIDSVHSLNKKIRFWNSPGDINAWNTYMRMGIDYMNTDKIIKLAEFLNMKGYH
jgi:alkaline phosphatase